MAAEKIETVLPFCGSFDVQWEAWTAIGTILLAVVTVVVAVGVPLWLERRARKAEEERRKHDAQATGVLVASILVIASTLICEEIDEVDDGSSIDVTIQRFSGRIYSGWEKLLELEPRFDSFTPKLRADLVKLAAIGTADARIKTQRVTYLTDRTLLALSILNERENNLLIAKQMLSEISRVFGELKAISPEITDVMEVAEPVHSDNARSPKLASN